MTRTYLRKKYMRWSLAARKELRRLSLRAGSMLSFVDFHPEDSYTIVCVEDGQFVGWAVSAPSWAPMKEERINMVYVKRPYRRKGIGFTLLTRMFKKFPDAVFDPWDHKSRCLQDKLESL